MKIHAPVEVLFVIPQVGKMFMIHPSSDFPKKFFMRSSESGIYSKHKRQLLIRSTGKIWFPNKRDRLDVMPVSFSTRDEIASTVAPQCRMDHKYDPYDRLVIAISY